MTKTNETVDVKGEREEEDAGVWHRQGRVGSEKIRRWGELKNDRAKVASLYLLEAPRNSIQIQRVYGASLYLHDKGGGCA